MSLSPNVNDKNRNKVLGNIKKLEKEGTNESKDALKTLHNIDVDGKPTIVTPPTNLTNRN